MQGIIEDAGDLVKFVTETLALETRALLLRNGANSEMLTGLENVFSGPVLRV